MKILQINSDINSGSSGRIAEDIGNLLINAGHESYVAYGRNQNESSSYLMKIGGRTDTLIHLMKTRLFDRHGFGSVRATKTFINELEKIDIDVIHLHNIHGYYLNIEGLFTYIRKHKVPTVWTFHDCWPFTGHCSFFDAVNCSKWQSGCYSCPNLHGYPVSWFIDSSKRNYRQKKEILSGLDQILLVAPSHWMADHLRGSFLSSYKLQVINNGIDLKRFRNIDDGSVRKKYKVPDKYILGIANRWDKRKGLDDFFTIRQMLNPKIEIVLVGLSENQLRLMPRGMTGIPHTENVNDLAVLYSGAEVFVNPTYIDNFPSTNIEAMACGTPVITYKTGGSTESVNYSTGIAVEKGNTEDLIVAIIEIMRKGKLFYSKACRKNAEANYDKENKLGEYISVYEDLVAKS